MGGLVFDALHRAPPLAQQVYGMVRHSVRSGTLQPGERLADGPLARTLGVSRSPVREALARLVAEGLLESGDGGVQVPVPTVTAMEEICDIRRLIEPPAAQRAARRMNEPARCALEAAVEAARLADAAGDVADFLEANYVFRSVWVGRLDNRRLRETIFRFDDQAGAVRRMTLALPVARKEALAMLEEGLRAFREADGAAAERFARRYIDGAGRHFRMVVVAAGNSGQPAVQHGPLQGV
ncbi:MAG: GntR family transcriptional regulator [Mesorhizobium sp.]